MPEMIKPKMLSYRHHVFVCIGEKCTQNSGNGKKLYNELKKKLRQAGLDKGSLRIKRAGASCLGTCQSGPIICVEPDGVWYYDINSEKLDKIIQEHLINGKPVTEYIYHPA